MLFCWGDANCLDLSKSQTKMCFASFWATVFELTSTQNVEFPRFNWNFLFLSVKQKIHHASYLILWRKYQAISNITSDQTYCAAIQITTNRRVRQMNPDSFAVRCSLNTRQPTKENMNTSPFWVPLWVVCSFRLHWIGFHFPWFLLPSWTNRKSFILLAWNWHCGCQSQHENAFCRGTSTQKKTRLDCLAGLERKNITKLSGNVPYESALFHLTRTGAKKLLPRKTYLYTRLFSSFLISDSPWEELTGAATLHNRGKCDTVNFSKRTGFSHCTKMVPVKSHNDFARPLVEKRVVWLNRNPFCKVRTHFYHDATTHDWWCDLRVVEKPFWHFGLLCWWSRSSAATSGCKHADNFQQ